MTTRRKYWLHISSTDQETSQVNTAVSRQTARNFGLARPSPWTSGPQKTAPARTSGCSDSSTPSTGCSSTVSPSGRPSVRTPRGQEASSTASGSHPYPPMQPPSNPGGKTSGTARQVDRRRTTPDHRHSAGPYRAATLGVATHGRRPHHRHGTNQRRHHRCPHGPSRRLAERHRHPAHLRWSGQVQPDAPSGSVTPMNVAVASASRVSAGVLLGSALRGATATPGEGSRGAQGYRATGLAGLTQRAPSVRFFRNLFRHPGGAVGRWGRPFGKRAPHAPPRAGHPPVAPGKLQRHSGGPPFGGGEPPKKPA